MSNKITESITLDVKQMKQKHQLINFQCKNQANPISLMKLNRNEVIACTYIFYTNIKTKLFFKVNLTDKKNVQKKLQESEDVYKFQLFFIYRTSK